MGSCSNKQDGVWSKKLSKSTSAVSLVISRCGSCYFKHGEMYPQLPLSLTHSLSVLQLLCCQHNPQRSMQCTSCSAGCIAVDKLLQDHTAVCTLALILPAGWAATTAGDTSPCSTDNVMAQHSCTNTARQNADCCWAGGFVLQDQLGWQHGGQ